ncbi:MAG: S9 family peptidase [Nitrospiraceae bacterium]|nr:S9 family peptidase [Nitrospiraceae bacterium]
MPAIDEAFKKHPLPPAPKRAPAVLMGLGGERVDDYYWMRDISDPETAADIQAESAYAKAVLGELEGLRSRIYDEFISRIQLADSSVPQRHKNYWYYSATSEDSQYERHLRYLEGGEHQVMLDENELAQGYEYFALGSSSMSDDEEILAYAIDTDGSELFRVYLLDLRTGETREIPLERATYGLELDAGATRLFWVEADDAMRPWRVWCYDLAMGRNGEEPLYQEDDEAFAVGISKSKDDRTLVVESHSTTSSEVAFLDLVEPGSELEVFIERTEGLEYSAEPIGEDVFVLSNYMAENFRISLTSRSEPRLDAGADFVPYDPDIKIESFEVFDTFVAIEERRGGFQRIRLVDRNGRGGCMVPFDTEASTLDLGPNPRMDAGSVRYSYTSMRTPRSIREIDFATGEVRVLKDAVVKGGFDPENYVSTTEFVTARDGTKVPVSIMARKGVVMDGSNPLLLYGYGSYESSTDPGFSSLRLSLIDRGFVFAIAHVRGGGEMGRQWYLDGKLTHKHNTFNDFVDAAAALCELGWTSVGKVFSWGGSAGGMLVAAALNQRPDLFGAVVAEVPFVDCLTTISDPTLPLTVGEWEEWGNPLDDWEIYQEMVSWSPYDNVRPGVQYPPILASTGLNDPRVSFFEPLKWVAKLRAQTSEARVVLWVEEGAGHFGSSGRFNEWETVSRLYAFLVASAMEDTA